MARDPIRLNFRIDAYSPATLPMGRLAEYLAELATMLGERDNVHFVELQEGSVQLVHAVEHEAYPKVETRMRAISMGEAPAEADTAYRNLNRKLAEDNASAVYEPCAGGAEILPFPGIRAPKPIELLPVEQPGRIDGIVIGIGGRTVGKNVVPVIVDTGEGKISCTATRAIAKQLGAHVFDAPRRFQGTGHWQRESDGTWVLKRFQILSHDELDDAPLTDVVRKLRAIPSDLGRAKDPLADILRDRRRKTRVGSAGLG